MTMNELTVVRDTLATTSYFTDHVQIWNVTDFFPLTSKVYTLSLFHPAQYVGKYIDNKCRVRIDALRKV